ncbi:MAG TPA: exodeoxyribonuclease VII large subunit [Candidatus Limnocylindria bacterium]|nr:exodeoxyribonuclease VII large subunit [Candidatus Limnocylindria bacterium]
MAERQPSLWDIPADDLAAADEPSAGPMDPAPSAPVRAAPRILRVSDLNRRVRQLLDVDATLADVWVEGEVSQPSFPPSGHCFFTLKDASSQIKAVLFREELAAANVRPEHGMQVIVHGRVRAYEPQGVYQLYVTTLTPAGAGDLHQRYEALRAKLAAEGLFDDGRKRPLPRWPRRIGVVTSPVGVVWRDIANVMRRRYPLGELVLVPTHVQGAGAAGGIVRALKRIYGQRGIDLVILARGGGSLEDLWCFNDELVVRTIVASPVPVIVGVGHESDVTLADFAADVRAPTPSAAAEQAAPDLGQFPAILGRLHDRASTAMVAALAGRQRFLGEEDRALMRLAPDVVGARQRAAELVDRGHRALVVRATGARASSEALGDALRALSPAATLERGYAVARLADGTIVRDPGQAAAGDALQVTVARGTLATRVETASKETQA